MHWNTLKIAAVVALLASPSAIAAIPGSGAIGGNTSAVEAPQHLQLADHRGHSGRWSNNHRPRGGRYVGRHDGRRHGGRYDRHNRHQDFRGDLRRHYRGNPHRQFRGRPIRRFFRQWRRHH